MRVIVVFGGNFGVGEKCAIDSEPVNALELFGEGIGEDVVGVGAALYAAVVVGGAGVGEEAGMAPCVEERTDKAGVDVGEKDVEEGGVRAEGIPEGENVVELSPIISTDSTE